MGARTGTAPFFTPISAEMIIFLDPVRKRHAKKGTPNKLCQKFPCLKHPLVMKLFMAESVSGSDTKTICRNEQNSGGSCPEPAENNSNLEPIFPGTSPKLPEKMGRRPKTIRESQSSTNINNHSFTVCHWNCASGLL